MTILDTSRQYWVGSVFVVEWDLVDVAGQPVTGATVVGTISKPSNENVAMVIDHTAGSNTYRASYKATAAGRHGFRVEVTAGGDGAISGEFIVGRDVTGAVPITKDEATDLGKVRLLTTDLDEAFPLHTDAQLAAFLALEGGSVKRAAAAALEAIARSETLVSKKITTQDLSTDGPAVAKDLRESAKLLRDQAAAADAADDVATHGYGFDSVDYDSTYPYTVWG